MRWLIQRRERDFATLGAGGTQRLVRRFVWQDEPDDRSERRID